ncbi:root phototropism protein 3 [Ricinus communis]|uniref:root phototropism protein 3 n=1 Tax=Ricinus communis TaxID=3988 RepID=UPI00201A66F1|nr:root phototropism protein 3 [Ricinus communis]
MKSKFLSSRQDKATMGRRCVDGENATGSSVTGAKQNKCILFPAKVSLVAEAFERRNQNWIVHAKVASDLTIQIGDSVFQLHKLPMVSRSGFLNRLVFQRRSYGEKNNVPKIQIDNFPGGAEIFEIVVKFCYGWNVDLTAANIAPAYCAAHFLEMSDDLEQGNLISKTETFLSFILLSSWKDIFQIFKSCEAISSWAKKLHILKRCSEAIAWKASIDQKDLTSTDDALNFNSQENNAENLQHGCISENWWFDDVSFLRIDQFLEVIECIKRKGIRSELVGSCIAHWTEKWLSQIPFGQHNLPKHLTHQLLRVTAESLIKVLPPEKNSVSCNFLLHLLKLGVMMRINSELSNKLEQRIALMLEECSASDLLVKNYDTNNSLYDVKLVARVVEAYLSSTLKNPAPRLYVVGRLVDEYLTMIARDEKLSVEQFQLIAETLPKDARYCNDKLYRAIDMYFKAHPTLTEEERTSICRAMDYHKLSKEARHHAMKNERLPLYFSMRIILLEQVNVTKSMTGNGSNYRRTRTQTIIRVSKGLDQGCLTSRKEIKMMKQEVENMKVQLNALQMCKMQLQRQVKGCTF